MIATWLGEHNNGTQHHIWLLTSFARRVRPYDFNALVQTNGPVLAQKRQVSMLHPMLRVAHSLRGPDRPSFRHTHGRKSKRRWMKEMKVNSTRHRHKAFANVHGNGLMPQISARKLPQTPYHKPAVVPPLSLSLAHLCIFLTPTPTLVFCHFFYFNHLD